MARVIGGVNKGRNMRKVKRETPFMKQVRKENEETARENRATRKQMKLEPKIAKKVVKSTARRPSASPAKRSTYVPVRKNRPQTRYKNRGR